MFRIGIISIVYWNFSDNFQLLTSTVELDKYVCVLAQVVTSYRHSETKLLKQTLE